MAHPKTLFDVSLRAVGQQLRQVPPHCMDAMPTNLGGRLEQAVLVQSLAFRSCAGEVLNAPIDIHTDIGSAAEDAKKPLAVLGHLEPFVGPRLLAPEVGGELRLVDPPIATNVDLGDMALLRLAVRRPWDAGRNEQHCGGLDNAAAGGYAAPILRRHGDALGAPQGQERDDGEDAMHHGAARGRQAHRSATRPLKVPITASNGNEDNRRYAACARDVYTDTHTTVSRQHTESCALGLRGRVSAAPPASPMQATGLESPNISVKTLGWHSIQLLTI